MGNHVVVTKQGDLYFTVFAFFFVDRPKKREFLLQRESTMQLVCGWNLYTYLLVAFRQHPHSNTKNKVAFNEYTDTRDCKVIWNTFIFHGRGFAIDQFWTNMFYGWTTTINVKIMANYFMWAENKRSCFLKKILHLHYLNEKNIISTKISLV